MVDVRAREVVPPPPLDLFIVRSPDEGEDSREIALGAGVTATITFNKESGEPA
jgi:hypothetical protein